MSNPSSSPSSTASKTGSEETPPLRVGVVGIGWAGQQHLESYKQVPGVEVVAIAGKEVPLLDSLAGQHSIPNRFEDWQEMLELDGLDAISVAVPTALHAPIAIAALERGIHVLSEKPLARDGIEGSAMVDAARAANRVLDVTFNHRLRGDIQALAGVLRNSEIGTPYYARAAWLRRRGIPQLGSWFTNKNMAGGGTLLDIGVHVLDFSLFLLGEPEVISVSAATYSELGTRKIGGKSGVSVDQGNSAFEVEDFASAFVRLSNGVTLVLESSWAAFRTPIDSVTFSVLGTDGGAELLPPVAPGQPGKLEVYRDVDGEIADYPLKALPDQRHSAVIHNFVDAVRDPSVWAEHDGSIALKRARIIDACYLSAAEGREVILDEQ